MKYFSFALVFVFFQIIVQGRTASVLGALNKSNVIWETEELPVKENTNSGLNSLMAVGKELMDMLQEMKDLLNSEILSDDPNVDENRNCSEDQNSDNVGFNQRKETREKYLTYYTTEILELTGWSGKDLRSTNFRNSTVFQSEKLEAIINKSKSFDHDMKYPDYSQTLAAHCTFKPNATKENLLDLHFNLSRIKSPNEYINVTSAWLKIFKMRARDKNYSNLTSNHKIKFMLMYYNRTSNRGNNRTAIRRAPQVVHINEERWIEWDVRDAVSTWFNDYNDTGKNFGRITIKVADKQENFASPVHEFFNTKNCSNITELPNLLPDTIRNEANLSVPSEFPYLSYTFQRIPEVDRKFNVKHHEFVKTVSNIKNNLPDYYPQKYQTKESVPLDIFSNSDNSDNPT